MNKVFGINFFIFCLLTLFVILYFSRNERDEGFFGMSPGTMDQLASTRVVSEQDQIIDDKIYDNLTQQGIANMTESGYDDRDFDSTIANY